MYCKHVQIALASALLSGCVSVDQDQEPVAVTTQHSEVASPGTKHSADTSNTVASNIEHLKQTHNFTYDLSTEATWQSTLSRLKAQRGVVASGVALYDALSHDDGIGTRNARYEVVLILSFLELQDAVPDLDRIARSALPSSSNIERYKGELEIRYRAIDGLGKLGAIPELQNIYRQPGVLGPAAGSALMVAGAPPSGVSTAPSSMLPSITLPSTTCLDNKPCKVISEATP